MGKILTTSCRLCGYIQNESVLRCLDCGNVRIAQTSPQILEDQGVNSVSDRSNTSMGTTSPAVVLDLISVVQTSNNEEEQQQHIPTLLAEEKSTAATLDIAGFRQLLPFLQEMLHANQETKLQQILDRLGLMEQLQVKLSHAPEVHVYMPEPPSSPPLHETVVNLPHPPEPRKTVKIVERDERGLIVKITEQETDLPMMTVSPQEQDEKEPEN